jgi:acyl-coenzyme A synthetase/AMP-(fatty) acid ligase
MVGYVSPHPQPIHDDGWLSTGDSVRLMGDRVLFLGRADRRVNVGGNNVSPEEVEVALLSMDDIVEAKVSGTPSPLTGNVLVAEIVCGPQAVPESMPGMVRKHLSAVLEGYKIPRIIRVVDAVSMNQFGKKDRTD